MKKSLWRQTLYSGLAYGLGLSLGSALQLFIADAISFAPGRDQEVGSSFLLIGMLLAFLISALAGGIGGFAGGWTLPVVDRPRGRWGYAWQGAVSLGVPTGLFLFVTMIIISFITFYGDTADSPTPFASIFAVAGIFYGLLIGLLLGILTVGWRRTGRIILYALIGFGLGGIGYGLGLREFLMSVSAGDLTTGNLLYLLLGIGVLGFVGGSSLGMIYSRMATETFQPRKPLKLRPIALVGLVVVVLLILFGLSAMSPLLSRLSAVLTPTSARLSTTLESDADGTHWSDPVSVGNFIDEPAQAALAAGDENIALVWKQKSSGSTSFVYQSGRWNADIQNTLWSSPVTVDQADGRATEPQIVLDKDGVAHLIWRAGSEVLYSRCQPDTCTEPAPLSGDPALQCDGVQVSGIDVSDQAPAVAIGLDNQLMVVWHGSDGNLLFASNDASLPLDISGGDCVPYLEEDPAAQMKLAGGPNSEFTLVFAGNQPAGDIRTLDYAGKVWNSSAQSIGKGHSPQTVIDAKEQLHVTWCGDDGLVRYWHAGGEETIVGPSCQNRPELALDNNENVHIVWLSDELIQTTGATINRPLVYETIQKLDGWTEPAIVAQPNQVVQPVMVGSEDGVLHQVWTDQLLDQPLLAYASQVQYECDDDILPRVARGALAIARDPKYQPLGDTVPFCQNRYDRLLFTPTADPSFSDETPTPNGGFDQLADLIRSAEYEALISTMEYSKDHNDDSPGTVVAGGVADLYHQLKEDPSRYPRGLTVRILLGNRPPLVELELNALLWHLLSDLRDAGVPEMANDELGWKLEVANYEGSWPHSHAKIAVIDGKTVVAAGFNMEYGHLAADHDSGEGEGTADTAIQVTGPIAQDGRRAFDELWEGAVQRHCTNFFPKGPDQLWWLTCSDSEAVSDHIPEVKRYYLPGEESVAFSFLRTLAYDEADQQTIAALGAAEERIDVMHTMFTLPGFCIMNYLLDVCSTSQAMPYMQSILDALEQNEARARLLIDLAELKGIENSLALAELQAEIKALGLEDRVEIRAFPGPVHAKVTLVDDEFLIIGSHNYHWSAFGTGGGLAEYSMGVTDPRAIDDYQRFFNYYWDEAGSE